MFMSVTDIMCSKYICLLIFFLHIALQVLLIAKIEAFFFLLPQMWCKVERSQGMEGAGMLPLFWAWEGPTLKWDAQSCHSLWDAAQRDLLGSPFQLWYVRL